MTQTETREEWLTRLRQAHRDCGCGHQYANHGPGWRGARWSTRAPYDSMCYERRCECNKYK